ncbi:hypothetical protein SteCoe_7779 [Stentor coeruleus]|uniref:Phospholipid-transporting ATPase n=1 Tax=Stentor coeruleus TaxID=5963 RepID=A0A1R2CM21_9CILI|nr:hypothetical protein SteCoe_7779 [Stentor coeruleus]
MSAEETDFSSRTIWANFPEVNQGFANNCVKTTKYNLLTFLPFSLFIQFRRVSNIYFLITAILQSIPQISPLQPFTAIAPLVFVLGVSMIREGIEDYLRYKSDKEINSSPTMIYKKGRFQQVCFEDIKVGDVVFVVKNQVFPCDIVMLSNSNENGTAYIETSSLDGEKALKSRQAFVHTQGLFTDDKANRIASMIKCELPNSRLYNFSGTFEFHSVKYPLDKAHLLLAGAFLRNTEWAIGVSVYTGGDTKLRQNMMGRKYKESRIEHNANRYIALIIILQFCLCIACAIASGYWVSQNIHEHTYIRYEKSYDIYDKGGMQGFLSYFTYFLLLNTMLPISLIISLELLKLGQGFFMMMDIMMYSEKRDRCCKVSSFSLNEELGMIKHIFSDKTGTLTCNQMEFKFFCTGTRIYGDQSVLFNLGLKTKVTFEDREIKFTFNDKHVENDLFSDHEIKLKYPVVMREEGIVIDTQRQITDLIIKCLALCHECIIENTEEEGLKYTGPSPDDVVLVDTARRIGYTLMKIKSEKMYLEINNKLKDITTNETFERICILEFNSDRKRMSVVLKDLKTGKYMIFMKGADNFIIERLSSENHRENIARLGELVGSFSRRGFRTLVMSFKYISEEDFNSWKVKYDEAITQINGREAAVAKVAEEIETDMYLLGCTAVEDALQDDVPETINDLLKAGLSFWMLTGDKLETAENIGKTCSLIDDNMVVEKCSVLTAEDCYKRMKEAYKNFKKNLNEKQLALIIEGSALQIVLYDYDDMAKREKFIEISNSENNRLAASKAKKYFLKMSNICKTIICCRVSPGEKREVVKLVKDNTDKVTLSIGDGANDVPMILEAHIGVGLYGEEGIQAVQASDYALGEFRYLWELLLVHGRFNYIRQSEMILYFFYKNLVFTLPQFLFAHYCAYSGQTVYDDWYLTFYNLVFTALPLFMRALFERDYEVPKRWESTGDNAIDDKKALRKRIPTVYKVGMDNQLFTLSRFVLWIFNGILHAIIVFFIPLYASEEGIMDSDGRSYDQWSFSIASFSSIIIIVNLKLAINTKLWNKFHYICMFGLSILLYFVFILIYDAVTYTSSYRTVYTLLGTHYYYFCILANVFLVCAIDVAFTTVTKIFWPTDSDIMAQETISLKKGHRKTMSGFTINENSNSDKCNEYEVNKEKNRFEAENLTMNPSVKKVDPEDYSSMKNVDQEDNDEKILVNSGDKITKKHNYEEE